MITFFMMLCFVMGWISKGMIQAIKDYRLSLQLNRIKFSEMDYETLKRENKAYLSALQQRDQRQDKNSRGGGRGVQSPRASSPAYDFDRIEELKMRYKEEETEEYR